MTRSEDRRLLLDYAAVWRPRDLWSSPPCTAFTRIQYLNAAQRHQGWRPPSEEACLAMLSFCRLELHPEQLARGGRSHHEQSACSSAPFDDPLHTWPWAISNPPKSQRVFGCQVGLRELGGLRRLLATEWRVESTSEELLSAFVHYQCRGDHAHGSSFATHRMPLTVKYTPRFAHLVSYLLRPGDKGLPAPRIGLLSN